MDSNDLNSGPFGYPLPPLSTFDGAFVYSMHQMYEFMPDDFPDSLGGTGVAGIGTHSSSLAFEPTTLVFGPNEPSCFYDSEDGVPYRGQDHAKKRIDVYIRGMEPGGRVKYLLVGAAGTGKTTLARIIAARINMEREQRGEQEGRLYEILPSQISAKEHLDSFMSQLEENDIVFIDEVHAMERVEDLFKVLDDTGQPLYPLAVGGMLEVPPSVSWIAATTDPGHLEKHTGGALPRRLEPRIALEAPGIDTLVEILKDQDFPVHPDAAHEAAKRSGGLPWQVKLLYEEARRYARVDGDVEIRPGHMVSAFEGMGLDEYGLLPQDRSVIKALLSVSVKLVSTEEVLHKAGEIQVCEMAGVDRTTYKKRIQPKLMRLKLLTIRGGQCLTDRAISLYGHLKE